MKALAYSTIQNKYPDEWVLLGDPVVQDLQVVSGVVLFHHKDKKELTILGRNYLGGHSNYQVVYTGKLPGIHRLGILRKLKTA